jgi:hypothetical protein
MKMVEILGKAGNGAETDKVVERRLRLKIPRLARPLHVRLAVFG